MDQDADEHAPGAAITVALCGHWDHEPPCPLAPHHTHADRRGGEVHLRILFAAEPDAAAAVRDGIDSALSGGQLDGPDGVTTHWRLRHSQAGEVHPDEAAHAARLAGISPGSGPD
jgi:hypothetical protein